MKLNKRLKTARKHADLTQKGLAIKSGVKQQTISRIETGKAFQSPGMIKLAIACEVRPEWLENEDGDMLPHTYEYTPTGGVRVGGSPDVKYIPIENTEDNNELNPELRKAINYLSTPPPGMNELAESIVQMINKLPTKNLNHLIKNKKPDNIKKGGNS